MATNHLEQLIAEWYEFQGYFVRRNVNVGKRPKGGYECELDVVAFNPSKKKLIHIEPSLDADSWEHREKRFTKKFAAGRKYIPKLFDGLDVPVKIDQIAVFLFASKANKQTIGGGKITPVPELLREIIEGLGSEKSHTMLYPKTFRCCGRFNSRLSSGAKCSRTARAMASMWATEVPWPPTTLTLVWGQIAGLAWTVCRGSWVSTSRILAG